MKLARRQLLASAPNKERQTRRSVVSASKCCLKDLNNRSKMLRRLSTTKSRLVNIEDPTPKMKKKVTSDFACLFLELAHKFLAHKYNLFLSYK